MAEKIIRQLIDDLDGKSIDQGFGERIGFSYQGAEYAIDLRPTNAEKFDAALKPFIQAAAKVGPGRRTRSGNTSDKSSGSGRSREQLQAIRDWATQNGHVVAPRGRVRQDVIDAFEASH